MSIFAYSDKTPTNTNISFPKNLIFVSPHPDDIALTFAGLIRNNHDFTGHNNVEVLIFNQSQWMEADSHQDLSITRIRKVSKIRLNEEIPALDDLFNSNIRLETYGFADAPIRHYEGPKTAGGGPGGDFSTFRSEEENIYQQLIPVFEVKLRTPDCAMFVLLANGHHIDHFLVREAVITAARHLGNQAKCQIYFGEDQPYTGTYPEASVAQMTSLQKRLGLQKISYTINEADKINLFKKYYISQYSNDYVVGIKKWAQFDNNKEDIYLWPRANYAKAPAEESCSKSFCK